MADYTTPGYPRPPPVTMASATRTPRTSARTSARHAPPTLSTPVNGERKSQDRVHEKSVLTNGEWLEPPLKPPAPSFMDHKGLERLGVLVGMQPLGTMPSAKVKAKAKGDAVRRAGLSKHSEADDSMAPTPDATSTPHDHDTRAHSIPSEEGGTDFISTPADVDDVDSQALSHEPSAEPPQTTDQEDPSPSSPISSGHNNTSAASSISTLRKCIIRATASNRHQTDQIMRRLMDEMSHDSGLATVVAAIESGTASHEMRDTFKRRAQRILSDLRPQRTSSRQTRRNYDLTQTTTSSPPPPPALELDSISVKIERNSRSSPAHHPSASPERKAPSQPKYKINLRTNSKPATNGVIQTEQSHATIPSIEHPPSLSRRSSSSSLSSIDELLAEATPPPMAQS